MPTKKELQRFVNLLGVVPPAPKNLQAMRDACRAWHTLHPELARLEADEAGLLACRQYMHIEMTREYGPRMHMMDRLYKRLSSLRRDMETNAMVAVVPAVEEAQTA